MGSTKKAIYKVDNGTDFDVIHFETEDTMVKTQSGASTLDADLAQIPYQNIFRQAIINGNFDIWQRGTTSTISNSAAFIADRWCFSSPSGSSTFSRQSFGLGDTIANGLSKYFGRFTMNDTNSVTPYFYQKIENVDLLQSKTITLSFLGRCDKAVTLIARLRQNFGSGGSPSASVDSNVNVSIPASGSFAKYSVTVALPSTSGKTLGANGDDCLQVMFILPSNLTMNFDITQVQLNVGSTAISFMPKSYAQELQDCMRYYEISTNYEFMLLPIATAANGGLKSCSFKVKKRTTPTITVYSESGSAGYVTSDRATNRQLAGTVFATDTGFTPIVNSIWGTAGTQVTWYWAADAEP